MKLTEYFLDRPKLSHLILVFIFVAGISTVSTLPRQDNPNVEFDILRISTFYPGASPEDVEINVTDPIEDELEEVDLSGSRRQVFAGMTGVFEIIPQRICGQAELQVWFAWALEGACCLEKVW